MDSLGSMNVNSLFSEQFLNLNESTIAHNITKFEDDSSLKRSQNSTNLDSKNISKNGEKIKISLNKIPQYKPNGFKSKVGQVSIDISSIQSPEHKAIYKVDNISIQHKNEGSNSIKENISLDNLSNKENSTSLEKHGSNEIIFDFQANNPKRTKIADVLKNSSNSSHSPVLMMNFLKSKIGAESFDLLIERIDNSDNQLEFINTSELMKNLLGKDYNQAANIIKIILNMNRTPHSTGSTSGSFSTKYSFSNIN
jgi:hypothetical protein